MADLRCLLEDLGFSAVKSLLQSGNLVFQGDGPTGTGLERLLEVETFERLKVTADYLVRKGEQWDKVVAGNPFPEAAKSSPNHLVVMCLKTAPPAKRVEELRSAIKGPEVIACEGKELYAFYPAGIGRSKLSGALIESRLGTRGTARNWNTVLKLAALLRP
jgi:uncharacterized protein (DUF1697 family)